MTSENRYKRLHFSKQSVHKHKQQSNDKRGREEKKKNTYYLWNLLAISYWKLFQSQSKWLNKRKRINLLFQVTTALFRNISPSTQNLTWVTSSSYFQSEGGSNSHRLSVFSPASCSPLFLLLTLYTRQQIRCVRSTALLPTHQWENTESMPRGNKYNPLYHYYMWRQQYICNVEMKAMSHFCMSMPCS